MYKIVPHELQQLDQWCGSTAGMKRPFQLCVKAPASITRPITWNTFDDGLAALNDPFYEYIGVVLTKDDGLMVVDLDDCIDIETGDVDEVAALALVRWKDTYYEVSKSGTGLHFFFKGELEHGLATVGVEAYSQDRFIIVTGNSTWSSDKDLLEFTDEDKEWLYAHRGAALEGSSFDSDPFDIEWFVGMPTLEKIKDGGRHNALVYLAGVLKHGGFSMKPLTEILKWNNAHQLEPPLDDDDLGAIIKWISKKH